MKQHVVKISDELYQRMKELQKEKHLRGVGDAVEYHIEKLEEQK